MQASIGFLLCEMCRLYSHSLRERLSDEHDTSSTQSYVLIELGRAQLLTQHELGRRLSLDKGWISRAVENLVKCGLVEKSQHDNDRRNRWLKLTQLGETRYQALNVAMDRHAEQLLASWTSEQRNAAVHILQALLSGLQNVLGQEEAGQMTQRDWDALQQAVTVLDAEKNASTQPAAGSTQTILNQEADNESLVAFSGTESTVRAQIQQRIVGSKTLPIRPLRSQVRSAAISQVSISSTPSTIRPDPPLARPIQTKIFVPTPNRSLAALSVPAAQSKSQGSLFQKLLFQGSLFNKLLQRGEAPHYAADNLSLESAEDEPQDNILLHPAAPADWNEIRNLLTANRLPTQGALNHLGHFTVATDNGRVVGVVGMEVYGDSALLRSLVVTSNMRHRKIGRRLLKYSIERAVSKQVSVLYLLTASAEATAFFSDFGFETMPRADMPTKLYVSMELQGPSHAIATAMRLTL